MIARRFASLRSASTGPRDRRPGKNRAWRFLVITLGSGALAALIAIVIAGIPTVLSMAFPGDTPPQIQASALFPPSKPVHKIVDVYDPPPRQAPQPNQTAPSPTPTQPTPTSMHSPRPTPHPDD